jgi:uncharacterized protein
MGRAADLLRRDARGIQSIAVNRLKWAARRNCAPSIFLSFKYGRPRAGKELEKNMSTELKGNALITGASSGIGAVYADRLARQGYDLILVARNRDRLDALAFQLTVQTGRRVEVIVADLSERSDLARIEQVLRTVDSIDMLVNNAGCAMSGDLVDASPNELENMIRLNVLAPTLLALAAISGFIARGRGTVINISSVLALIPELFNGSYGGTKAYLLNLSLRLQREVANKGVRVQVVLPGAIRTGIWQNSHADIGAIPSNMIMDADKLVDAALAGLNLGEIVTIPSLSNLADWEVHEAARRALIPNLSLEFPAARYDMTARTQS